MASWIRMWVIEGIGNKKKKKNILYLRVYICLLSFRVWRHLVAVLVKYDVHTRADPVHFSHSFILKKKVLWTETNKASENCCSSVRFKMIVHPPNPFFIRLQVTCELAHFFFLSPNETWATMLTRVSWTWFWPSTGACLTGWKTLLYIKHEAPVLIPICIVSHLTAARGRHNFMPAPSPKIQLMFCSINVCTYDVNPGHGPVHKLPPLCFLGVIQFTAFKWHGENIM